MLRLAFVIALALETPAFSQEARVGEDCVRISNNEARLECFDAVYGLDAEEPEISGDGWILVERKDEFNGANTSSVYLEEVGRIGQTDAAVISVGCRDDGTYGILFYKRTFINTSNRISIRYKFDDNETVSENWWGTAGSNGAILPDNYRDFRSQLVDSDRLVIEAKAYQGARHRHTFEGLQKNKRDLEFVMNGCS